jgi:hypothetical protein
MTGLLTPQRQTAGNGLLDQAPRRVDDRVAGLLGLDPSIQRGAILPFGRDASGEMVMAWPEMALDTLKSLMLPGHVVQGGEFTPRDVTEMALDVGMLSTVAPAPAGAKRMFGGISAKNARSTIWRRPRRWRRPARLPTTSGARRDGARR